MMRCDERFTHAFTSYGCVFKEITLVGSNQGNYLENDCRNSALVYRDLKFDRIIIFQSFSWNSVSAEEVLGISIALEKALKRTTVLNMKPDLHCIDN